MKWVLLNVENKSMKALFEKTNEIVIKKTQGAAVLFLRGMMLS